MIKLELSQEDISDFVISVIDMMASSNYRRIEQEVADHPENLSLGALENIATMAIDECLSRLPHKIREQVDGHRDSMIESMAMSRRDSLISKELEMVASYEHSAARRS